MSKILHSENLQGLPVTKLRRHLGKRVQTYAYGVGTLVMIKDGYPAIRVRMYCGRDGCKHYMVGYLRRGPGGPDHYVVDYRGNYLADLRDQEFVCDQHK